MRARAIFIASLLSLAGFPAHAQQPPGYGETIEVRVVNLDVIVNDRDGNPVTGLTRDDFEIFENGKRKEISNFLEIDDRAPAGANAAAAAPVAHAEHRALIFFIDNTSLHPFNRNRVIASMKEFVERTMRAGDMAAIVTCNPGLKSELEMNGDREKVIAALQALGKKTGSAPVMAMEKERTRDALRQLTVDFQLQPHEGDKFTKGDTGQKLQKPPYGSALAIVSHYADGVMAETQKKSDALRNVIGSVRGVEGRKAIIFLTESFSLDPARQMFEFLDSVKGEYEDGLTQNPRTEILRYADEPMFAAVTSAANAAGVTLYPISATGMSGGIDLPSVTENTVSNSAQLKSPGALPDQALNELASATGGLAVTGTNDFLRGFNRIANDLTAYYSLGYRADPPSKDSVRSLTVKVKKPGLVVRNRENFLQKTPKTEVVQAVADNLFAVDKSNAMGITVKAGARVAGGDGRVSVPIDITIPMSALTLQPQGSELAGRFTVYTGFTRADGTMSQVKKSEYPIHFAAETLKKRESVTVRINVTMDETTEAVSVGVVDQSSNATGFGSVKVL